MEQQNTKTQTTRTRRQTYIIPKRALYQRYPLVTIWGWTIAGVLVFFSRPIYDAFIRQPEVFDIPADQRRAAIQKAWKI